MDNENQYKYQRIDLASDTFRLLRLLRGSRGDSIQCELFEAFLHQVEGVPYEALSYCWGDSPDTYAISINDRNALVKENLHMALLALRQSDEDRLLWIDAICIDQNNDKEKGHQVGQMRQIYENAEQVVIWLGPSNCEIDSLMDLARRWDYQTGQRPRAHHAQGWIDSWVQLTADGTGPLNKEVTAECRNALQEMLNRPWFRRVWILQEVASANRATILCGSKAIPSRGFSLLPFLLDLNPEEHVQAVLDILPGYRRKETWWGQKQNLETLLVKFRASEATDQRDNIYALLGIASDARTSDILRPDYELPFCEVVRNTILFLFSRELVGRPVLPLPDHIDFADFVDKLPRLADCILGWGLLEQTFDDATTANLVPRASDINRLYDLPNFAPVHEKSPLEFTIGKKNLDNTFRAILAWHGADTMLSIPRRLVENLISYVHGGLDDYGFEQFKLADYRFEQLKQILHSSAVSKWKVEDLQSLVHYAVQKSQPKICKLLFEVTHCMDLESSIDILTRAVSDEVGFVRHNRRRLTVLYKWFNAADEWTITYKFVELMDLIVHRSLTHLDEPQCADMLAELFVEFFPSSDQEPPGYLVKIMAAWRLMKRGKRLFVNISRYNISFAEYYSPHDLWLPIREGSGPPKEDHQLAVSLIEYSSPHDLLLPTREGSGPPKEDHQLAMVMHQPLGQVQGRASRKIEEVIFEKLELDEYNEESTDTIRELREILQSLNSNSISRWKSIVGGLVTEEEKRSLELNRLHWTLIKQIHRKLDAIGFHSLKTWLKEKAQKIVLTSSITGGAGPHITAKQNPTTRMNQHP